MRWGRIVGISLLCFVGAVGALAQEIVVAFGVK
jgi:hypothetical protein